MIYNTQIVRDDDDKRNINLTSDQEQGPYKPSDYKYVAPTDRFEQPAPNITSAKVLHDPSIDAEDVEPIRARTRVESRTIFGQFIMTEFAKKHPKYAGKLNFAAIVEACNISADLKRWYAQKRTEWGNMVQFPDWAARSLDSNTASSVQSALQEVSSLRRDKAIMEQNASKYMSTVQERIEKHILEKVEKVYKTKDGKTNWLPIIFSLTAENLPVDKIIDIVDYRIKDAGIDTETRSRDDYLHPPMYEYHVLDDFKKTAFMAWKSGEDLSEWFPKRGVTFVKSENLVVDANLSDISTIVNPSYTKGKGGAHG